MIVLQMNNVTKYYVTDLVFENISLQIQSNSRIGIVGKNGAGKTTLMRIMAGVTSTDTGTVSIPKHISIGYLTQQMSLESDDTVYNEMTKPFTDLLNIKSRLDDISLWLSTHEYDHPNYDENVNALEHLQNEFESGDGYLIDSKIKSVVTGLNFTADDLGRQVNSFSGGQKTRLALAQMLLKNPDILLLDEPTNHLDMNTVEWLENYLAAFDGAVVIISHDRYFLDKTVNKIYELELFKGTLYHGSYSQYLIEKDKRHQLELKKYEAQQKEIKNLQTFVEKNITRASTSGMAKSRRKQLEKLDRIDTPVQDRRKAKFKFEIARESGGDVLHVKDLAIGYDTVLNSDISFSIKKGDRLAIIGPNGIGKTTLVQTIAGRLKPHSGEVKYGSNVRVGYYDQKQAEISSGRTVLEELWHEYPEMNEQDIRGILGQFLFTQDDVLKQVNTLSGGEKARIQLAKLMLEKNNLLVLDEPTNHLDIDSKEMLEQALASYPGTLLFVSHDRYFIDRIANRVMHMDGGSLNIFEGDYTYFLEKQEEMNVRRETELSDVRNVSQNKRDYQSQKVRRNEIRRLERELEDLDEVMYVLNDEINAIELRLTDPDVFNDYEKAHEVNMTLMEKNDAFEDAIHEYEQKETELKRLAEDNH